MNLNEMEYGELLDSLRRDLHLDPLTDLLYTKGLAVTSQVPQANQALVWNGSSWVPTSNLQLLSAQKLQLALGSVTFTYTAATTSATQVINHGLPGNPRVFFGNVSGTPRHDAVVTAFGAGTFTAEAYATDNAVVTGGVGFCWIAIG